MKKINVLFFAITIAISTIIVTGCGDDIDPPTITVTEKSHTGYYRNDTVTYEIIVSTNEKLERLTTTSVPAGLGSELNMDLDGTSKTVEWDYIINNSAIVGAGIDIKFTVTQDSKENETNDVTKTITVATGAGGITSKSAFTLYVALGDGSSDCLWDISNTTAYSPDDVAANSSLESSIDFGYNYFGSDNATIAAPSNWNVTTDGVSSWGTKNPTKFKEITYTSSEYTAMTDDTDIVANVTGLTETEVTNLSAGDFIGFETVGGKKGIIKVGTITGTYNIGDNISLEYKIQQ